MWSHIPPLEARLRLFTVGQIAGEQTTKTAFLKSVDHENAMGDAVQQLYANLLDKAFIYLNVSTYVEHAQHPVGHLSFALYLKQFWSSDITSLDWQSVSLIYTLSHYEPIFETPSDTTVKLWCLILPMFGCGIEVHYVY